MSSVKLYNLSKNFGFRLNVKANIIDIIPADGKPLGYSNSFFIGKLFTDFLLPDCKRQFLKYSKKTPANDALAFECEFTEKSREKVWYKVSIICKIEAKEKLYFVHCNNINELKKQLLKSEETIELLDKANELNTQIIQSTQAIILVLNLDKTVKSVSKGIESVLGYDSNELINKKWFKKVIPKSSITELEFNYDAFIQSKKRSRVIVVPTICKDGTQKIISWQTSKIITNRNLIGTVAIGKNITDITTKVRKLEASEKRFRNLAEQMMHPVSFVTIDGEFVFLNKAFTKQFGYRLKDFPNIETVVNKTKVNDKTKDEGIRSWKNEVRQLFLTQKPITNKIEVETKTGAIRQVQYSASLADGYVYYVYTDITEQKAKEDLLLKTSENFRQIASNTPVAIAGCSVETSKITFANKHFINAFGYTVDEINKMDDWGNIIVYENEVDEKKSLLKWEEVKRELFVNNKAIIKTLERSIRCKDGSIKNIEVAITYNSGVIYALFYDITSRKANQLKLKQSELKFRKLAELVPTPISFITMSGEIVFFNKAYTNQFGYTTKEVPDVATLIKNSYAFDEEKNNALKNWKQDVETLKSGHNIRAKRQIVYNKKGEKRVMEYAATMSGDFIYYAYLDITAQLEKERHLEKSKETFRRIAQNTPIPIAGCNVIDFTLTFSNKKFYETFGFTYEEIKSFDVWYPNIIHDSTTDKKVREARWKWLVADIMYNGGKQVKLIERKIICNDKSVKFFEIGFTYENDTLYVFFYDITQRKEAEDKLKESEKRFRTLAELLPTPISCKTTDDKIIFLNQAYTQQFGYTLEDIPDFDAWLKNAYRNDADRIAAYTLWKSDVADLQAGKTTPVRILEVYNKQGQKRFLSHTTTISESSIYCAYNDITEQLEFENKINESELRFRNIVENLPIPLVSLNPVTGVLFSNKKHQSLIGHNNSSATNNNNLSIFSVDDIPDEHSRKHFAKLIQKVKNNKNNGQITEPNYTIKIVCKDKNLRTFEITESIFGNTLYTLFHDITEQLRANELLKESEQKFKALAENMPIAIGGYDIEGKTIFLNKYFTDVTGYTQQDLPTIKDWYRRTQPNTTRRIEFYNYWTQSVADFRNGKLIEKPEIKATALCKDGSFKYFTYSFSIHKDITYILIIDITEEEKAKRQLEKSHQELRSLASYLQNIREEERKNISREIHDELGQQLTGIKMDVSAIFKKVKVSKTVQEAEFKQVLDMLNFSVKTIRKISSQLRPSILDDLGLIAAFEWLIQDFRKRTSINCHFYNNIDEKEINIDLKNNLFRILQESLTNIMRHASATLVNIDFFMIADQIRLIIADNGKGFNQNSPKATLGILGMRERASILNGTFVVVSEKMKGTRIIISIPFKK